jgi:glycosyltransferase involved in cell wall biosynthesis
MKILLLNQCFYPDVVSTAQHLTDLAVELAAEGHSVTVLASRRGYDNPAARYLPRETWKGISIIRIPSLGLGKRSKWRRILDIASYWASCLLRLALLPRFDVVVALTSPPLISALGALFCRLKGGRFVCWVMDLNPDEAVAAGWLRDRSLAAGILDRMVRYSFRRADRIVALDRFMKDRIVAKGIPAEKVAVVPPWSHDDAVRFDGGARQLFRARHGLSGKFVVMYSGNHSPCHPLDTVLEAARRLAPQPQFMFCFVGGGKEFGKVQRFARERRLENVLCLPYQPLDQLSGSLSAADLHLVVLGEPFVGIVHPCKVYNILRIGSPLLAISPTPSHLTDLLSQGDLNEQCTVVPHGDVEAVVECVQDSAAIAEWRNARRRLPDAARYSKAELLPQIMDLLVPSTTVRELEPEKREAPKSEVRGERSVTLKPSGVIDRG